jgi:hypothetical protein
MLSDSPWVRLAERSSARWHCRRVRTREGIAGPVREESRTDNR